jgi:hypothetical protein
VIEAYGKGEIKLPEVPVKTNKEDIRHAGPDQTSITYTATTVACFLGWTKKNGNHIRPNFACETAFKALDLIDAGFLSTGDMKGLKRSL